jgi:hypothetical protein
MMGFASLNPSYGLITYLLMPPMANPAAMVRRSA